MDTALGVRFTPSPAPVTAQQHRERTIGGLDSGVRATVPGWEEVFSWDRQAVALPLPPRQGSIGFTCGHSGPGLHPHGEPAVLLVLFGSHLPGFLQPAGLGHSRPSEDTLWLLISVWLLTVTDKQASSGRAGMGVSGPRSLLVGLPLVVTCHILAQEGTLGGNTAICQETPLDILPLFVLRGARLFVTVSGPFVAKTVNKLKSIKRELGQEMGKLKQGQIISSKNI